MNRGVNLIITSYLLSAHHFRQVITVVIAIYSMMAIFFFCFPSCFAFGALNYVSITSLMSNYYYTVSQILVVLVYACHGPISRLELSVAEAVVINGVGSDVFVSAHK